MGAADEIAQRHRLLEPAGVGVFQIIAGARPAEFGDHDALAGKGIAQFLVDDERLVHRLLVGKAFPVGKNVRGDEIDGGGEFRVLEPDIPDFACGHGNIDRSLDALDQLDQILDLLLAAVDGLVADDNAVDVAVALGEIDRRQHLAFVAVDILVDPGADRDLEFDAAGRGVKPDRPRQRRQCLEVGADFFGIRNIVDVGMGRSLERRIRYARQDAFEIGRLLLLAQ